MKNLYREILIIAIFVFFTLLMLPGFALTAKALEPDSSTIYAGIDVSIYQGDIDFNQVRSAGIEIVYIRAGAGDNYIDPNFERNYQNATAAGLRVGFYHYVTATTITEAQEEARFFANLISGKSPAARPAMDFEVFYGLSRTTVNNIARAYLERLQELTGYLPMIYTDANNARTVWDSDLSAYPLWVADYFVDEPEDNDVWSAWAGWQYSDRGSIAGISGNVDLDRFTPTVLLTTSEPTPAPEVEGFRSYTVQRGNTLSGIARRFDTTVAVLVQLNNIPNPNLIYVGQVLRIPEIEDVNQTFTTYTIRRGDTLSGIARRFGTRVSVLAGLNDINNINLIYAGDKLIIP